MFNADASLIYNVQREYRCTVVTAKRKLPPGNEAVTTIVKFEIWYKNMKTFLPFKKKTLLYYWGGA